MGFCSGTDIFDPVAKFVLESDQSETAKEGVLRELIIALWDHDWDCESDSAYRNCILDKPCKIMLYTQRRRPDPTWAACLRLEAYGTCRK